jgi:hypothetical protein
MFAKLGGDYFINYIFPKSWNEKVGYYISNYYFRSPFYTVCNHKWLAKKLTEKWVGEQYVVPTFGVWDKVTDIDWDKLPKSFVLKSCFGFQGKHVIVVHNKNTANKEKILTAMKGYINESGYIERISKGFSRKRIIAETLLVNTDGSMPVQYEFFCGRGNPLVCRVNSHRQTNLSNTVSNLIFYDIHNWQKLPIQYVYNNSAGLIPNEGEVEKPKNLDDMIRIATQISSHIPVSRIDLYSIGEKVYVGEITLGCGGGFCPIVPFEWDFRLGENVELIPAHELDEMIKRDIIDFPLDEIK